MRTMCMVLLASLGWLAPNVAVGELPAEPSVLSQVGDAGPQRAHPQAWTLTGTVAETMNTGKYTYVEVDTGKGRVWCAGPETQVAVGDRVVLSDGFEMVGFYSSFLDRTFDSIYLVPTIEKLGEAGGGPASPPGHGEDGSEAAAEAPAPNVTRAAGGHSVGEIFESSAALAGEQVTVRGKVVKFSAGILGRNWIHLQDGTAGPKGARDLVVTTDGVAAVGDTLLVRGTVVTGTDLGHGYVYDVLIEKASITLE